MLILRIPKPRSHKVWQDKAMNRDQVIRALKAHEQELRAAGVVSVSLFDSTARGVGRLEDLEQHRFQKEIDKDRALAF